MRSLLEGPRPLLYQLRSVKEELVAELGPQAAARSFAEMAGWSLDDVRAVPVAGLWDSARSEGTERRVLSVADDVEVAPVPVFGEPPPGAVRAPARRLAFVVLQDALVSSKSNIVLAGDRAVLDFQGAELSQIPVNLDVDPVIIDATEDAATVLAPTATHRFEAALSLAGIHSYNFGHWLIEFLPRVFACLRQPGFERVPLLIDRQMPQQHLEALRLFVGPDHPVSVLGLGEAAFVERLWSCTTPAYVPIGPKPGFTDRVPRHVMDDRAFAALHASIEPVLERYGDAGGGRRLYLTRAEGQHRRMVNRPDAEAWFAARGFEVHDLGLIPFAEQLRLVRGAETIVGAAGSSMLLTQFAVPGTRIGVLSNEYVEDSRWLAFACRGLGLRLSVLRGEDVARNADYEMFSEYRTPMDELPAFLEALSGEG